MKQNETKNLLKKDEILPQGETMVAVSPNLQQVIAQFSLKLSPAISQAIKQGKENDPIARQFMPTESELSWEAGESDDPIGDATHSPVKGIVHRYPDRALLMLTNICAVHCRYCFRRAKIGRPGNELKLDEINNALKYINNHKEIWEVILSGGDPLILSDRKLNEVLTQLRMIKHVRVMRIHTRIPIALPERLTPDLIEMLRADRAEKPLYMMIHCNHARELTQEVRKACGRLADAGIPLLSQSVLLRGVNNNIEDMRNLMRALVETRIKPHYLHHGDMAQGTSHFRTTIAEGQNLMREMRGTISGLCQPTYILDIPGGYGKVPVGPAFINKQQNGDHLVADYRGNTHTYREKS
ncbi:MAG: lysine-2,3-aminomutase-like protein [Bdellovibrionales bacterium]